MIELDPFTVSAQSEKDGYAVKDSLAGTRVRTDLRDIASSISVVNAQFMKDTGVRNNQDLLVYTTNTEVGGIQGNYAGVGSTFIDGASEASNFLKPSQNTRVRGLDSADNTRDFFGTDIPWDGYIVDRVDLQRGPNSILFGLGSPAGIINSSINSATFKEGGNVENRVASFGTVRFSLDYNKVIIPQQLSVRVAALDDRTNYRQHPAYNHDQRYYAALRFDPKLFGDLGKTSIRVNYEHGKVNANRPRVLTPEDRITPYFATLNSNGTGGLGHNTYDPYYIWATNQIGYTSEGKTVLGQKKYYLVQYMGPTAQSNPMFIYDSPSATNTMATTQGVSVVSGAPLTAGSSAGGRGYARELP